MLKRGIIVLLTLLVMFGFGVAACEFTPPANDGPVNRAVAAPYVTAAWQGFKGAAVTYTFDDGCSNQPVVAVPMFNQYNYDGTFFLVTSWVTDWAPWRSAAAAGHEIASHTVSHARLGGLSPAKETAEYTGSRQAINADIPGNQCLTIAYPNCRSGTESLCAQYYIGGRNCSGGVNPVTPADLYEIKAYICGSRGSVKSLADFTSKDQSALTAGGWIVYLVHGIDNDGGYSPLASSILRSSLDYLSANAGSYWVASFSTVIKYIKERNAVTLTETSVGASSLALTVTDTLDNAVYNCPVTFRRPLPAGWNGASVAQNGKAVAWSVVTVNGARCVMFDAVPDSGSVVISQTN